MSSEPTSAQRKGPTLGFLNTLLSRSHSWQTLPCFWAGCNGRQALEASET